MTAWDRAVAGAGRSRWETLPLVREVWIERVLSHTRIVNSLGCDVGFDFTGGSAGLEAVVDSSTMRHAIPVGASNPDPSDLAAAAVLEAAGFRNGRSIPPEELPVVLSPRAASVWLRWVAPWFVGEGRTAVRRGEPEERSGPALPRRPWFHIVDEAPVAGSSRLDGEGRCIGDRTYLREGQLADRIVDSRDPSVPSEGLGPMRRDSFRDHPYPGALGLAILAGEDRGEPHTRDLPRGVQVTSLTPRVAPGGEIFLAEVRGHWIERGDRVHPIPPTLMKIGPRGGLGGVAARGNDVEPGPPGLPALAPSLLFEGVELVPL